MGKMRLDIYLVENNLVSSREKARAVIMSGIVYINNQKADKAGEIVPEGATVEVRGDTLKYVSRGGLKLEKALIEFDINLDGKIAMDIGASTGGFTDCMLQNGASQVYAVDVGYGQLAWRLRNDPRVVNMERTNVRYIDTPKIDFATIDVSFISLKLVLPVVKGVETVCLIKPQFEAGREKVGKKGVVRDKAVHIEVIENIVKFSKSIGFKTSGISFSPIKGPEGNIEYLLHLGNSDAELDIEGIVDKAWGDLS